MRRGRSHLDLIRSEVATDADLSGGLLRVVVRRAGQLVDRIDDIAGLSVEVRLARLLLRLAAVDEGGDRAAVTLDLRQQDLADMCFTTVPTISRTLTGWERSGFVTVRRGHIQIPRLSAIADIGGIHLD